jgi:hypothetical protein
VKLLVKFSSTIRAALPGIGINPRVSQTKPLATAPSARSYEPQSEKEHNRSDGGVDRETDNAGAEMNSEAMEKPVADESANNANGHVADETETVALYNLARQPPGNDPDDQNDNQPLARQMHAFHWPFALIRHAVRDTAKKLG